MRGASLTLWMPPKKTIDLSRAGTGLALFHESERFLIMLRRLIFFPLQNEQLSETLVRWSKVRLNAQRSIERLGSFTIAILRRKNASQIVTRLGSVRHQPHRLLQRP